MAGFQRKISVRNAEREAFARCTKSDIYCKQKKRYDPSLPIRDGYASNAVKGWTRGHLMPQMAVTAT